MRIAVFLISILSLVGCATSEVSNVSYNNGNKFVTIKYLNNGADFVVSERRRDAIVKAKQSCGGGKVELLDESNRTRSTGAYAQNINNYKFVNETTTDHKFLIFRCLENSGPEVY